MKIKSNLNNNNLYVSEIYLIKIIGLKLIKIS